MLTYCGNHFAVYGCQVIMLYSLNFYGAACPLYLNKTEKKSRLLWEKHKRDLVTDWEALEIRSKVKKARF